MNTINLLKKIMAFFIGVFILLTPTKALSLDDNYIHSDFNEEYYWSTVKTDAVGDGNEFSGIFKHIEDIENGCFYLYFSFTDYKLNPNIKDNITIGFTVENANNKYYFSVDKNGFTKNSDDKIEDYIEIKYSFDKSSCARYGGEIYLGFELKNKTDKTLTNYISCQYYCGEYSRHTLFNSIKLDMNETQQSSEEKTNKHESGNEETNTHSNEANSNNVSGEKTDNNYIGNSINSKKNNSDETSTKFSGTRTITTTNNENETSIANSEKFSGNNNSYEIETGENQGDNATAKFDSSSLNGESNESGLSDTFGNQNILNYSNQRTKSVKIMIIASIAIISVGVMCVLIGAFVRNKHEKAEKEMII